MFEKENIVKWTDKCFSFLLEEKGFRKVKEKYIDDSFGIIYVSDKLRIRLESYRCEIYVYISKLNDQDNEANLFAVLEFLNEYTHKIQQSNYYSDQNNLHERARLQLEWISESIRENLDAIYSFFVLEDTQNNIKNLREFLIQKHPDLYRKQ